MRTGVTRGGSLDIGFYHRDTNRLKMTIELFVNFNQKSGKTVGEIMCLMMRTMGSKESSKESDPSSGPRTSPKKINPSSLLESFCASGVMWSLCVDKEGSLIWTMGNIPVIGKVDKEHSVRSEVGMIPLEGVISQTDQDGDENGDQGQGGTWTHIAAVVDCTSTSFSETEYLDAVPNSCTVTLYVNSEKVASGVVLVPVKKEPELALPGILYIGPCLPAGSRLTETRVVRCTSIFIVCKPSFYFI